MTDRNWIGEAEAAFDQSLSALRDGDWGSPEFWAARANAAASIASAEQARIANLIAWKQLQASRAATADAGVGLIPLGGTDGISAEIEHALGMDEEETP